MKIKNLLLALLALPLLFVACEPNNPVDEVKDPTVAVTAGATTESTIAFTVASTDAEKVAYLVVEGAEAPTASEVLANGVAVEANKSVAVTATELKAETDYTIVAAAQNTKGVVKSTATAKTLAAGETPTEPSLTLKSVSEMSFAAEGGAGEIVYELKNAVAGTELEAEADAAWISDITVAEKITFAVAANDGAAREGKITATYGALSFEVKVKQAAVGETPNPDVETFVATHYAADFDDSEGFNGYAISLSDKEFGNTGYGVDGGTYYNIYFIAASKNGGKLPQGTYTLDSSYGVNTIIVDYSSCYTMEDGELKNNKSFKEANLVITNNKIEFNAVLDDSTDTVVKVVYEGELTVDDGTGSSEPEGVELIATEWTWGGSSNYGYKYMVSGEDFSVDVHFQTDKATQTSIVAGEYIWTSTSWWGFNDFEDFTTRTFVVDGTSVAVDGGIAVVENEGDYYFIEITLEGRDGVTYIIYYEGELADEEEGGEDEPTTLNVTSLGEGAYNSAYYFYTFKAEGENFSFNLLVNESQAQNNQILAGSYTYAPEKSLVGNKNYFYVDSFKLDGVSYKASGSSTMSVEGDGSNVVITLNLAMQSGDQFKVTYNGKVGGSTNEGGSTELTKLATPTVVGEVAGNAATISWNEIAGAKNYTVTLNGTKVDTVETAYIVYQNLEWETQYSVSVVANPADTTLNLASDAGTATFSVGANPDAGQGGGDGGNDEGGNDDEGDQGVTSNATLKFVKDLASDYGSGYEAFGYYEITNGDDVVGFWIFNGNSDKTRLYDGTFNHVLGLSKLVSNTSTAIYIEKVVIDGVNNGGAQASSTLVVEGNGANVTLTLDYNVVNEGVKTRKYTCKGVTL